MGYFDHVKPGGTNYKALIQAAASSATDPAAAGTPPPGEPTPAPDGMHPYAAAIRAAWLHRLDRLTRPWVPGASWDHNCYVTARKLIELANSPWSGYALADAHADYLAHAPHDNVWDKREKCWGSAQDRAGTLPEPDPHAPVPEVTVLDLDTEAAYRGPEPAALEVGYTFRPGGSFILDTSPDPEPLWGSGQEVLLADGEALIIASAQGLGKTTLAQQLTLGRCGFPEYAELLGYPITPGNGTALYLAMDRPKQAARSFRRMVGESWRAELDDRLRVWQGPPPFDLAKTPSLLTALCRQAGADTVVVDSLKDAAVGLTDDEVGGGWNRARQTALEAGVQVIELHHNRKAIGGAKAARPTIDDLYGSTWIPSGAGSVILLTGAAGDPIVGLYHLKQPAGEVGPLKVIHDHEAGRSTVFHAADLVAAAKGAGLTAVDAARVLFEVDRPTASQREKARRRLVQLERSGLLAVVDPGDKATSRPTRWGVE